MLSRHPSTVYSSRLYARLAPDQMRFFRYLLEGYDNLAYTSVVDRKGCILKIVFAPGQAGELHQALAEMRQSLEFELLDLSGPLPWQSCLAGSPESLDYQKGDESGL